MNIDKELNLLNQKIIYDFTKFTTTDYIGHLSCIIWFISCNFRCQYCYNDKIVFSKKGEYTPKNILDFLEKRVGLLDAVVLSGGEATSYNLTYFCSTIKKLGYKIKLDTNGTSLMLIQKLIELKLIDYLAIDFKAPQYKFKQITNTNKYNEFINTVKYLIKIDFPFELRSTINSELLNENDINNMINLSLIHI